MADIEAPSYVITGEVPQADWALALSLLGRLGITAEPHSVEVVDPTEPSAATIDTIEPGTIPYHLDEITSRDQYLAFEHAEQFWPKYRDAAKAEERRVGSKSSCLFIGLPILFHPQSRDKSVRLNDTQSMAYAKRLGLELVRPRSEVGFSDERSPSSYGAISDRQTESAVATVGSFIDFMKTATSLTPEERPHMFDSTQIRFLGALAEHLEVQIEEATNAADA